MENSIDVVKNAIPWLKSDVNQYDYTMLKSGKKCYNIKRCQLYQMKHSPICDFVVWPQNSHSINPFNLSSFYLDFRLDRLSYSLHQFILRFDLYNTNASDTIQVMPMPLIIDRVSLLRNSNILGNDICDWDVYFYNLQKCCDEGNQMLDVLGMQQDGNGYLNSFPIPHGEGVQANLELPISLNRSYFVSSFIRQDITVRVYFKSNIAYSGSNADIKLDNVKLFLRTK